MKGLVSFWNPPPDASEANATSRTTTRPFSWSGLGSLRGVAKAISGRRASKGRIPWPASRRAATGGVAPEAKVVFNQRMGDVAVHFDVSGLIPVVVQDHLTGEIRMFAHATVEAVRATLVSGRATFWSRSRNELWEKGLTSGNTLEVRGVIVDCDEDCLIYSAEP